MGYPPFHPTFYVQFAQDCRGATVKLMKWLSKTIDEIYHAKFIADWFDIRDGDPLQNLPDFATEYLLTKYGLRRVAEMHMYELVMSLKNNFSKNRKAMACARFLGVVKKLPDTAPEKPELDIGTLQVFLYTRRRIIYTPEQILASDGGGMDEGAGILDLDPRHVTMTKDCRTFVPLRHAVTQIKRVCGFMAHRKLERFLRTIEKGVAMRPRGGGKIQKISQATGGTTAVRFAMRAAVLGTPQEQHEDSDELPFEVVTDVDICMEVLLEVLAIRSKQVEEMLLTAFVDGDDNGDGVLSVDEFEAIIKSKKPEFSSRRAVRMFKMALEKGKGNSTSIERPAFVETCKAYGMGLLVDTRALDAEDARKREEAERAAAESR